MPKEAVASVGVVFGQEQAVLGRKRGSVVRVAEGPVWIFDFAVRTHRCLCHEDYRRCPELSGCFGRSSIGQNVRWGRYDSASVSCCWFVKARPSLGVTVFEDESIRVFNPVFFLPHELTLDLSFGTLTETSISVALASSCLS